MQPQDDQNQEWRAPQPSGSAAPFQVPDDAERIDNSPAVTDQPAGEDFVDQAPEAPVDDNESDEVLVRWEATEHIHHDRSIVWFLALGVVVVLLMVMAIVLMQSITFAILIPVMAATLIIYVKRPPQTNTYTLSRKGLHINDKLYTYAEFKSFGIVQKNEHNSIVLIPRKRFQVDQTILFPDEVGEAVVDMFAARLPMKDVEPDVIDRLLAKLHL